MSLRWGILSTARINDAVLGAQAVKFVAVASRSLSRAQAYAAQKNIPRAYGSYDELLAAPDIDAVYNPLPNALHVPWTIRALQAGKHVLCEKPFARGAAEAERAFAIAEREGLVLAEAFMWRHHPQVARARELIDSGAIGGIRFLHASFAGAVTVADVRWSRELEGGALMDVGCYCVNGLRALAGAEPEVVSAQQVVHAGEGVDAALAAVLRFPHDVLATLDCAFTTVPRERLEAAGEEGVLAVLDPWHARRPVLEVRRPGGVERFEVDPANAYALELQDVEAAARGERPPLLGRADAVGQARTIEALYASAEAQGRPVRLS
jgi:predicted dehydrogenase